ncbi:MAG: HlyD family efflux transporter periplasmic adaptor subunit [Verrucomicrobiota bacterium]
MTSSFPRLRRDLAVSRQATANGIVYVIKDPVRRQFYRFGETEHFIASQLDGSHSKDAVRQRAERQFGAQLTDEALDHFIARLQKNGLLESDTDQPKPAKPAGRLQGSLLYLRFRLVDPNGLLDRLHRVTGFLFTKTFVVLSALCILLGAALAILNWNQIAGNVSRFYQVTAIPLLVLTIFVVITAHEFAHGLACKHFGGEVREMGFLLMYFQPAFYCNVSDAWLFPDKSKRLWVGFAGPYFELFLWSLATIAWRVTEVDTWINYVTYIVMASSGIKTLLNFNPLIKWDGYYLLSDWLELPNLRKRAFAHLGGSIKRLFGVSAPWVEQATRRERRVFLTYGLVASLFSFSFLGITMATVGGILIEQNQPVGLALFAGLLGTRFRRKLRKLFGKSAGDADDLDDEDGNAPAPATSRQSPAPPETPQAPEPPPAMPAPQRVALPPPGLPANDAGAPNGASGAGETPAPAKRKRRKFFSSSFKRVIRTGFVGGSLALLLLLGEMELRIAGPFNVLPAHNADVRAEREGLVEEVCVDEGDRVKAGDLVARLSDLDLEAERKKNEAEIAQAKARLQLLEAGPRAEEIQLAYNALNKAKDKTQFARTRRERDRSLFEQGLLSKKEFEDTQEQATIAENEVAEAKTRLEVLLKGTRPEEIAAARAELNRLETQRRYLEEQLQLLQVVSPAAGIVTTPSRQLREMKHQLVNRGDLIAKVHDFRIITAEIAISEKEIADVKVGQKVLVKARSHPDETFHGTVVSVATTARGSSTASTTSPSGSGTAASAPKAILVTTEIDNSSLLLKPEMTGQAKIYCGQRRFFDLVMRRLARTFKVEFWSWW